MLQPWLKIHISAENDRLVVKPEMSVGYAVWLGMARLLLFSSCESNGGKLKARREQSWLHSKLPLSSTETLLRFHLDGNEKVRPVPVCGRQVTMPPNCTHTAARQPKRSCHSSSLEKRSMICAQLIRWTGDAWIATSTTKDNIWRTTSVSINDQVKRQEERL